MQVPSKGRVQHTHVVPSLDLREMDIVNKKRLMEVDISEEHYDAIQKKILFLLSPILSKENVAKLLGPRPMATFVQAFTHRYASQLNLETLELLGDKMGSYALILWLKENFPNEQRESAFSTIIAKFLSKEKLSQYSQKLGLPALLIKPKEFPATETDKEDLFEAVMGAIVMTSERELSEGAGSIVVKEFLSRIFVEQKIDPANLRDYIDPVSLLKMATNVLYGTDPRYVEREFQQDSLDKKSVIIYFSATVYRRVRQQEAKPGEGRTREIVYKEEEMAHLEEQERERTKQKAKEAASKKALVRYKWTFDTIEEERRKKDIVNQQKYLGNLAKAIAEVREEVLERLRSTEQAASEKLVPIFKGKKVQSMEKVVSKTKRSAEEMIREKYGETAAAELRLPVEAAFEVDKNEEQGDIAVVLQTKNEHHVYVQRAAVRSKPSQLADAYFRLVRMYVEKLRKDLDLPPRAPRTTSTQPEASASRGRGGSRGGGRGSFRGRGGGRGGY